MMEILSADWYDNGQAVISHVPMEETALAGWEATIEGAGAWDGTYPILGCTLDSCVLDMPSDPGPYPGGGTFEVTPPT